MVSVPKTQYARSGDVSIAFQVVGEGEHDIVYVPGFVSNVELSWQHPRYVALYERLLSSGRLILFDKRGTGLSDRVSGVASLEVRMDDIRAVMDAAGSERAALFGVSEGASLAVLFAATYPQRTTAIVLYGSYGPTRTWTPETPWERSREEWLRRVEEVEHGGRWGTREFHRDGLAAFAPSLADDEEFVDWWARYARMSASPGAAAALMRMNLEIDVRHVLPAVRVPTLVIHRTGSALFVEGARYLAAHIPGAELVELPGVDHSPIVDSDSILDPAAAFLERVRAESGWDEPDRVLATVLFTDIVDSTARAAEEGDRAWRGVVEQHHALVRAQLARHRGSEIDTAGDGFFASFDGPARAIRCASAITEGVRTLGLEVRAGLHTGECELIDGKVGGIAVAIGARVAAQASPGEVLVSSTVKDLVAGSGLEFVDRGTAELKGVPGEWRLFAVAST